MKCKRCGAEIPESFWQKRGKVLGMFENIEKARCICGHLNTRKLKDEGCDWR